MSDENIISNLRREFGEALANVSDERLMRAFDKWSQSDKDEAVAEWRDLEEV